MRTPLLAGNWKMHRLRKEARALARAVADGCQGLRDRDVLVAPPFTALVDVAEELLGSALAIAGQDMFWEREGAFTGEVSGPMLVDAGCTHVIIGHSERRQHFGETDYTVAKKVAAAAAAGLTPIVCVGETLEQREAGATLEVIARQVLSLIHI